MPTVTTLVNRVCAITRLAFSGDSGERELVLASMNDAYQQAVVDTEALQATASVSLTNGTAQYSLASSPFAISSLMAIRYITVSGDGISNRMLERISEQEIISLSQGAVGAPVTKYAVPAPNTIIFWGTPGSGVTASISYVKSPPVLVEDDTPSAGEEFTPAAFPARFHYDLLVNLTCALAFEYDRRNDEAAFYMAQYERALSKFQAWAERFGGLQSAQAFPARNAFDSEYRRIRDDQY